ncbi:MAG TPA: DNA replication/repair protein RecF [Verrucomicrobiae bacterium]|nr:DNA replication/repair protein RecF [Verrucomicrobiae bacterium]
MKLTRLSLANFRNYAELELEPVAGLNVFVGFNAQGKSNLLEAIAMLGTGKSFRTSKETDVIRTGLEVASVGGDAAMRAGSVRLSCSVSTTPRGTRKIYTLNGQSVRYAAFLGRARVVTFVPADLHLVAGAPASRRGLLNIALAQEQPAYYRELAKYQKAVSQKNALLRGDRVDADLLAVYDRALVESGTLLMLARNHLVGAMAHAAREVHARWSSRVETFDLRYEPNVAFEVPTADGIGHAFETRLRERADAERARQTSLVGPHRDDLGLELNGASLAAYGSQGQQRTAVLALKVAEYTVMHERTGEAPLLLLDDVLSELDGQRAGAFLAGVGGFEQAFVTATHLPDDLPSGRTWRVRDAALEAL